MSAERESEGTKREASTPITLAAVLLLGFPAIYLFATGPITWLGSRGYITDDMLAVIKVVYWPIIYLERNSEIAKRFFEAWSDLWQ
jgi:hypothetical protein